MPSIRFNGYIIDADCTPVGYKVYVPDLLGMCSLNQSDIQEWLKEWEDDHNNIYHKEICPSTGAVRTMLLEDVMTFLLEMSSKYPHTKYVLTRILSTFFIHNYQNQTCRKTEKE